jgi:hypothetical protein
MDDQVVGESERTVQPRHSSLRIDITLSVGYTRERAAITDRWEMRLSTVGLLVAGAIICLVVLALLLPHLITVLSGG